MNVRPNIFHNLIACLYRSGWIPTQTSGDRTLTEPVSCSPSGCIRSGGRIKSGIHVEVAERIITVRISIVISGHDFRFGILGEADLSKESYHSLYHRYVYAAIIDTCVINTRRISFSTSCRFVIISLISWA